MGVKMGDYGKRECLICKKIFDVKYASQVTCSPDCQRERKIAACKDFRARKKATFESLIAQVTDKDAQIDALRKEIESLKTELKKVCRKDCGKKSESIKNFKASHDLKTCERMNLKALHLPCGERDECWMPSKCEKNLHSARPEKISRTIIGKQSHAESIEDLP